MVAKTSTKGIVGGLFSNVSAKRLENPDRTCRSRAVHEVTINRFSPSNNGIIRPLNGKSQISTISFTLTLLMSLDTASKDKSRPGKFNLRPVSDLLACPTQNNINRSDVSILWEIRLRVFSMLSFVERPSTTVGSSPLSSNRKVI